jgi:hypothetical protein
MSVRGFTASLVAIAAVLVFAGSSPATTPVPGERLAFDAIKHAPVAGSVKTTARAEIERAVHLVRTLPSGRREHVAVALDELGAFDHRLTLPRTLILVGQLKANDDYFSKHYAPADKTDITDDDGIVYRYFVGRCLEFHPLADFGALNAHIAANDVDATRTLADALVARGVYQHGGGIGWEYEFNYSGGRAPWLSGMAQAVAAQAFSRAAQLVPDRATAYRTEAKAAFSLIQRKLLTRVAAGPWIRLYAFSSLPVLNAQLQAVVSLETYAGTSEDSSAASLAARMKTSAAEMLSRFDTGYWTYYSLDGTPSPLDYQQFVVSLLKKLAPQDARFASAATRIAAYQHQPPAFMVANAGLGSLRFWLSKPSSVRVDTGAGPTKRLSLGGGWHTLTWGEPKHPGVFGVQVHATDLAGNSATFQALPFVRVTAKKASAGHATTAGPAPTPTFVVGAREATAWPAGATAPDPTLVAQLQPVAGLTLELTVDPGADPTALTAYLQSLVQQVPNLSRLVLVTTDPTVYATAKTALPQTPIGILVSGTPAPKTFLKTWTATALDFIAYAPVAGTAPAQLLQALGQQVPVLLDDVTPDALQSYACDQTVTGAIEDDPSSVTAAAAAVQRGATVCPGLAAPAAASTLTFPTAPSQPLTLGCVRDCLYLVTLDDASGNPVVATRGALRGGFPPALITLPQTKLKPGTYRVDVRLVNQVNPGPVVQQTSPPVSP